MHGPPGTGKTTVLVEAIRRFAARGEKVLAAAASNLAVDNLVERLAAAGLACVRVGHPARVLPAVLAHTLEARVEEHEAARIARGLVEEAISLRRDARKRKQRRGPGRFSEWREKERDARALLAEARRLETRAEAEVLDRADVALATLTGLEAPALLGRRFAVAVVDEATQAVEPALYLALLRADRAILAGDHMQLPPTVLSATAQAGGLGVSLFERLAALHGGAAMVTLAEQYRMNARIMRFPSEALYGGALRAHPAVADHAIDEAPFELVDTAGRGFEEESGAARGSGEAGRRRAPSRVVPNMAPMRIAARGNESRGRGALSATQSATLAAGRRGCDARGSGSIAGACAGTERDGATGLAVPRRGRARGGVARRGGGGGARAAPRRRGGCGARLDGRRRRDPGGRG